MNKTNVKGLAKSVKYNVGKYTPQILMGVGIAGMVTTTVLAVKATPKAMLLMNEAQREKGSDLTAKEKIQVAWKPYIPAVATGVISVGCLIGSSNVSTRRTAAIATAYKLSETALSEYKDAVIETIGEKKEKQIKEKVASEKIKNNPVDSSQVVITGGGETLCYDTISGRYFKSDIEKIKKVENEINYALRNDDYISLNYLYDKLGLANTSIGEDLGWNIDRDGYLEFNFGSHIADNGQPCIVLDYNVAPKYDYWKMNY